MYDECVVIFQRKCIARVLRMISLSRKIVRTRLVGNFRTNSTQSMMIYYIEEIKKRAREVEKSSLT